MANRVRRAGEQGMPQAELRRRAILEAALRVVAQGGVEDVTHRRVAGEAGVPLGSTTYYFASREDLLREAFRHHAGLVCAGIDSLADELPLRTAHELVDFLIELVRRELADPATILVEYELIVRAARDPDLAREVNAYERSLSARLGETLERLGVAQAFDGARTLIALVRGFELESLTRPAAAIEDLRRRLEGVLGGMTGSTVARRAARPAARRRTAARRTRRSA